MRLEQPMPVPGSLHEAHEAHEARRREETGGACELNSGLEGRCFSSDFLGARPEMNEVMVVILHNIAGILDE